MKRKHTHLDLALILIIIIYNLGITFFSMGWIFTICFDSLKSFFFGGINKENILVQFSYFFFAGLIGGSFYCFRGLYQRLSDAYSPQYVDKVEDLPDPTIVFNVRAWLFWYLYRPLQGGILSIILVCLFNLGFIGINGSNTESMNSVYFQVGIGFLVGFGTHEVINKIEEIIKVLFAKSKKKQAKPRENTRKKIEENEEIKQ